MHIARTYTQRELTDFTVQTVHKYGQNDNFIMLKEANKIYQNNNKSTVVERAFNDI